MVDHVSGAIPVVAGPGVAGAALAMLWEDSAGRRLPFPVRTFLLALSALIPITLLRQVLMAVGWEAAVDSGSHRALWALATGPAVDTVVIVVYFAVLVRGNTRASTPWHYAQGGIAIGAAVLGGNYLASAQGLPPMQVLDLPGYATPEPSIAPALMIASVVVAASIQFRLTTEYSEVLGLYFGLIGGLLAGSFLEVLRLQTGTYGGFGGGEPSGLFDAGHILDVIATAALVLLSGSDRHQPFPDIRRPAGTVRPIPLSAPPDFSTAHRYCASCRELTVHREGRCAVCALLWNA